MHRGLRALRTVLALATMLAIATVPLVADWCAVSCETARAQPAAVPACHHAAPSTPHVGPIPSPCSHDHHPAVVDAATTGAAAVRAVPTIVPAIVGQSAIAPFTATPDTWSEGTLLFSPPLPLALASTLRI